MTHGETRELAELIVRLVGRDRYTVLYRIIVLVLIMVNALLNTMELGDECVDKSQGQTPAVTVSVDSLGASMARIAFFSRPEGGWDVVAGIQDSIFRSHIADVLRAAAHQIDSVANWEFVDDPSTSLTPRNESGAFPF